MNAHKFVKSVYNRVVRTRSFLAYMLHGVGIPARVVQTHCAFNTLCVMKLLCPELSMSFYNDEITNPKFNSGTHSALDTIVNDDEIQNYVMFIRSFHPVTRLGHAFTIVAFSGKYYVLEGDLGVLKFEYRQVKWPELASMVNKLYMDSTRWFTIPIPSQRTMKKNYDVLLLETLPMANYWMDWAKNYETNGILQPGCPLYKLEHPNTYYEMNPTIKLYRKHRLGKKVNKKKKIDWSKV